MSDNYIKVTVTGNKSKSVSVKSTELKNQITAGADMSIYYSNKAKEWAISDKLVDNEDYSSKYHANLAKSYTEEGALQIAEITTLREQTLADIETEKQNVIDIGTEQINQVSTISNTAISDIETSKTNALSDIDSAKTIVLEDISTQETQTINNIKKTADVELDKIVGAGIDSRANIDLSNLSEVGGKHFLGKSQITNCITEIPQRIKADVVDGTLTVYAGSVAIVPYGTTDRTSEFPVGSTFIHENFKVVDTQFADDKFFVWVEVQNNISGTPTTTDTKERVIILYVNASTLDGAVSSGSGTAPSGSLLYYNTSTNLVEYLNSGANTDGNLAAFPLGRSQADGTNKFASITQTFNGFGYIGSTYWVDKGVKGLIANGRNADGILKNIEWNNDKLRTFTNFGTATQNMYIIYDSTDGYFGHAYPPYHTFNEADNVWYYRDGSVKPMITLGTYKESGTAGVMISAFNPKQPFRAADYNDIDGVWVEKYAQITSVTAVGTYEYELPLPNDNSNYEVLMHCTATRNTNSAVSTVVYTSSIIKEMGATVRFNDKNTSDTGWMLLPVGGDHKIKVQITGVNLNTNQSYIFGYRKTR